MEVLGDIELFAREAPAPVVAITGSNGKSTVTALLGDMARAAGVACARRRQPRRRRRWTCCGDAAPDLYVLELSSFQLETTWSLAPTAVARCSTSVADHLDRYADLAAYAPPRRASSRAPRSRCSTSTTPRGAASASRCAAGSRVQPRRAARQRAHTLAERDGGERGWCSDERARDARAAPCRCRAGTTWPTRWRPWPWATRWHCPATPWSQAVREILAGCAHRCELVGRARGRALDRRLQGHQRGRHGGRHRRPCGGPQPGADCRRRRQGPGLLAPVRGAASAHVHTAGAARPRRRRHRGHRAVAPACVQRPRHGRRGGAGRVGVGRGRHGAAVAGLRQLRHVRQLRCSAARPSPPRCAPRCTP